jgi:hypothetical protein
MLANIVDGLVHRITSGMSKEAVLLPDGMALPIAQSLWALDATPLALGELRCTGTGAAASVTRNGDELQLELNDVAALGSCPGSPVDGTLAWCGGSSCPDPPVRGTIDGTEWMLDDTGYNANDQRVNVELSDGSLVHVTNDPGTSQLAWGLIVTSPSSPFGGQLCVGSMAGNGTSRTFGDLSTLGACPTGSGTLSGCVR